MDNAQRDELLIKISSQLLEVKTAQHLIVERIDNELKKHDKLLNGNGQPGLISRVQNLEQSSKHAQQRLEDLVAQMNKRLDSFDERFDDWIDKVDEKILEQSKELKKTMDTHEIKCPGAIAHSNSERKYKQTLIISVVSVLVAFGSLFMESIKSIFGK